MPVKLLSAKPVPFQVNGVWTPFTRSEPLAGMMPL